MILGFVICITGCGGKPQQKRKTTPRKHKIENCERFGSQLSRVWDEDRLERLDLPVKVYQKELDAAHAERIVSNLNAFADQWIQVRTNACEQHNEPGQMTRAHYRQTVKCLKKALRKLDQDLDQFENGALSALDEVLFTLNACS